MQKLIQVSVTACHCALVQINNPSEELRCYWGHDVPMTKTGNDVTTQCLQGSCEYLEGVWHAFPAEQSCEIYHYDAIGKRERE